LNNTNDANVNTDTIATNPAMTEEYYGRCN